MSQEIALVIVTMLGPYLLTPSVLLYIRNDFRVNLAG